VWNIVNQHFGSPKIDTAFVKNLKMFIDKVRHNERIKKVYMYHKHIIYKYEYKKIFLASNFGY
jgi:hypothetical protein